MWLGEEEPIDTGCPTFREVSRRGLVTSGPLARLCTMMSMLPKSACTLFAHSDTVKPCPEAAAYLLFAETCTATAR